MQLMPDMDERVLVRLLYRTLLDREPDAAGFDYYVSELENGRATAHELAMRLLAGTEFREKEGQSVVMRPDIRLDDLRVYAGYGPKDLQLFSHFAGANPRPEAGFVTDFVGSRVRTSLLWDGCAHLDGIIMPPPIPMDYHAEAIEWIGTLKAILAARDSFAVMELGAGHGPWIAASAAAARLRGIDQLSLCAVEGDPGRFEMLRQNMADNDLMRHDPVLMQAAVGLADATVQWPKNIDPRNNSGNRPLREGNPADEAYLSGFFGHQEMIEINMVPLSRLLQARPFWDLVHMDVQGTEAELCAGCLPLLSERVRYLIVGTHSRKLDGDVMEILFDGGWSLENEKPTRICSVPGATSLMLLTLNDGAQVWRNPRL